MKHLSHTFKLSNCFFRTYKYEKYRPPPVTNSQLTYLNRNT